jgi:4-diphosphocytidyl-2-C-methyl-D-erythritol kinase
MPLTPPPGAAPGSSTPKDTPAALFREHARAKVNLTLHVLGKRHDGYHELESLVVFADLCDELSFRPGAADHLRLKGPFAESVDGENLVLKAKRMAAAWLGREISGDFELEKNIPVAAGLGGGSSDAAAAIRLLLGAYAASCNPDAFIEKAAAIGADVPVCLYHRAARMQGIGERVTPVANVAALPAVLVNPRVKLSTAEVFKRLGAAAYEPSGGSGIAFADGDLSSPEKATAWLAAGRNDLEAPAAALEPAIANVLGILRNQRGCLLARLSGSGPTCFGLFPSQAVARQAAREIMRTRPSWWAVATVLS